MGKTYPSLIEAQGGDETTYSPGKTTHAILGSERGTQHTKRIEADDDGNLYVHVAADDTSCCDPVNALANNNSEGIPDNVVTTLVTFTASVPTKITRIVASGEVYAKFFLFKNTVLIETQRSGPSRNVEFSFGVGLALDALDILDVKVVHVCTSGLQAFESTVYGAV